MNLQNILLNIWNNAHGLWYTHPSTGTHYGPFSDERDCMIDLSEREVQTPQTLAQRKAEFEATFEV